MVRGDDKVTILEFAHAARWTIQVVLVVSLVLALLQRNKAMLRTAGALIGCLVVNRIHYLLTNDSTPYMWYMVIDAITAAIVLLRPAGKVQAVIGTTFLVELAMHLSYWINLRLNGYNLGAATTYWWMLLIIALLQAALIGGWTVGGLARLIPSSIFHRGRGVPETAHPRNLV